MMKVKRLAVPSCTTCNDTTFARCHPNNFLIECGMS